MKELSYNNKVYLFKRQLNCYCVIVRHIKNIRSISIGDINKIIKIKKSEMSLH